MLFLRKQTPSVLVYDGANSFASGRQLDGGHCDIRDGVDGVRRIYSIVCHRETSKAVFRAGMAVTQKVLPKSPCNVGNVLE